MDTITVGNRLFRSIRHLGNDLLFAGFTEISSSENRRKILITTIFCLLSLSLLLFFGVDNLLGGRLVLATVLMTTAALTVSNYLYLRISGKYQQSSVATLLMASILFVYLFTSGETRNTGHLWFFALPGLVYFILGLYQGTAFLALVFTVLGFLLFWPGLPLLEATYSPMFLLRFFGALLAVTVISFVYEFSREDGRQELFAITAKLDHLSQTDELTGLFNRRAITATLRHEIARYERHGRPFCLLVADIDHFKQVNDRYGHECGDNVLVGVASALDSNTKKQDIVSRWGGEEFLILLPETTADQGRNSGERLRRAVEELSIDYGTHTISVTISIGITEFSAGSSINELIRSADNLLYEAKRTGRNRIV